MARGKVLRGSRTSSLMVETSSNPVNANASCGQKFTESQFHRGHMPAQVKCVTEPCARHIANAMATRISSGRYVHRPPAFCSHLPMRRPMMFRYTAAKRSTNEPASKNVRFCARYAEPIPPT